MATREEQKQRREAMREYKAQGHTFKEVAKEFGVCDKTAQRVCKGIASQSNSGIKQDEKSVADIIRDRLKNFEYYGNYTGSDGYADIRCTVCGDITTRAWVSIKHSKCGCRKCKEADSAIRKQKKKIELDKIKTERENLRLEKKAELLREAELKRELRRHKCPVCGEETTRPKYCSQRCANKSANANHEIKRGRRMKGAMVDKDITLDGLYIRDNGACWLCGEQCDYEDYTTVEGAFIAGDHYPSIDHVIPLSKGGLHSWDNVKLAHRICNSHKRDKIIAPTSS